MKKPLLFFAFIAISCTVHSQNITGQGNIIPVESGKSAAFNFSANAEELATSIVNAVGLKQNFTIEAGKVLNVEAIIRHGKRYIRYNPDFINTVNKMAKDQWASVFILAHEIGHHLNGHTLLKGRRPSTIELESDEFAGFVMSKMGATLDQTKLAVMYIASPVSSKTHPCMADRVLAVEKGWERASKQ